MLDADEAVGNDHPGALAAVVLDREPEGAQGLQRGLGHHRRRRRLHPTGTFGTEHPIGTGPFKFDSWTRNEKLTLVKNDDYWGDKAHLDTLIFRPIADNAARLQALQTGEIQGYDLVEPQDIATIEGDQDLQILDRPAFNVGVRRLQHREEADRRSEGAPGDRVRPRPTGGRGQLLLRPRLRRDAVHAAGGRRLCRRRDGGTRMTRRRRRRSSRMPGYTLPVPLEFWYPSGRLASVHAGSEAELRGVRRQPEQVGLQGGRRRVLRGTRTTSAASRPATRGMLRLLGWTGDYGDADNFIGTFFQTPQDAWGTTNDAR